jgi:hypothetical protein
MTTSKHNHSLKVLKLLSYLQWTCLIKVFTPHKMESLVLAGLIYVNGARRNHAPQQQYTKLNTLKLLNWLSGRTHRRIIHLNQCWRHWGTHLSWTFVVFFKKTNPR